MKNALAFVVQSMDPDRAPKLSRLMTEIERLRVSGELGTGPWPAVDVRDLLARRADVAPKTVYNHFGRLAQAGYLTLRGRYHRSRGPRRFYTEQPSGWFVRDLRKLAFTGLSLVDLKARSSQLAKSPEGTQR